MIPTLSSFGRTDSSKGVIIQILGEEWPLSAKEIFNRVKKNSGQPISYQAVHKTLGELLEGKVLEKSEKGYSLSLNWIDSGQKFFSALHASYTNDFIKSIEGKTLEFDTLYEVDQFLIQSLNKFLPLLPKRPVLCLHWNHLWLPLFLSREDYSGIKDLAKVISSYSLIRGSDAIDKWCQSFWVGQGMNVKISANVASTFDLVVIAELILQVFYPPEIKQKLDEIYGKTKSVKELDVDNFFHSVFEKKTRILIKVIKDVVLAEELRKHTVDQFK
jgi:hypothetical protein